MRDAVARLAAGAAQSPLDVAHDFYYSRIVDSKHAIEALAALAQETRLSIFRLLMQRGPEGLSAGAVAERLGVAPSTLSFHLAHLERAALLRSWRVQRQIFYAADFDGMRRLLNFLTEDCCGGRPEFCAPLPRSAARTSAKEASHEAPARSRLR
jgi:DNA-binding transcriptional ArsR family regulator